MFCIKPFSLSLYFLPFCLSYNCYSAVQSRQCSAPYIGKYADRSFVCVKPSNSLIHINIFSIRKVCCGTAEDSTRNTSRIFLSLKILLLIRALKFSLFPPYAQTFNVVVRELELPFCIKGRCFHCYISFINKLTLISIYILRFCL